MKETNVKEYLENLSFSCPLPQSFEYESGGLERKIFQHLVGSSRSSRLGPAPSEEVVKTICNNISKQVKQGLPIQIVSAWGADFCLLRIPPQIPSWKST